MAMWENTTKAAEALLQTLASLGTSAKSSGQNVSDLNKSVLSFGNAIKAVGFTTIYEGMKAQFKHVAVFTKEHLINERQAVQEMAKRLDGHKKEMLVLLQKNEADTEAYKILEDTYALEEQELAYAQKRLSVATVFNKIYVELRNEHYLLNISAELFYKAFHKTLEDSYLLNKSLYDANSAYGERYALVGKIFQTQASIGASTVAMAESSKALVSYGMEMEDSFGENLKLVTMLQEGLGVSSAEGASLAVTFERGLKQSARDVGDLIARVAAQTGLAAQKAAQYAIEIGKGLRLLGPTGQGMVGVVKAVETVAARVHELGGNSDVIVKTYRQMLGGGAESFMLRGLARTRVGALGTQEGAEQALEGIARSMRNIVRAAPGTEMYAAQLEMAGQLHQMAAEDVTYYLEAIEALHKPLTEAQTLQKTYNEQSTMVGKAFSQMLEALSALYKRAMLPVLEVLAPIVQGFADFVKGLAESKELATVATIAVVTGLGAATIAMVRLTAAAIRFAGTSGVMGLIPGLDKVLGRFTAMGQATKLPGLAGVKGLGELMGAGAGRLGLATGALGVVGAIAGAAGAGYLVGSIINAAMPPSWRENIGNYLYKISNNTSITAKASAGSTHAGLGGVRVSSAVERAARAISEITMKGKLDQAQIQHLLIKNANSMNLAASDVGSQNFVDEVAARTRQISAEAHFVDQIKSRTTVRMPGDERQDKLFEMNQKQTEAMVDTAENVKVVANQTTKHRKLKEDEAEARAQEEHGALWHFLGGDDVSSAKAYDAMRGGRWQ